MKPNTYLQFSRERALQIINNVAEEYTDHKQTNFATKAELCETIRWMQKQHAEEWERMRATIGEISIMCCKRLLGADVPSTQTHYLAGQRRSSFPKE